MSLEMKAVGLAATAVAMVEDCQRGPLPARAPGADGRTRRKWWEPTEMVLGLIRDERVRRADKWGEMPRTPVEWLMALAVEAGELAEAVEPAAPAGGLPGAAIESLRRAATSARQWLEESGAGTHPRDAETR